MNHVNMFQLNSITFVNYNSFYWDCTKYEASQSKFDCTAYCVYMCEQNPVITLLNVLLVKDPIPPSCKNNNDLLLLF